MGENMAKRSNKLSQALERFSETATRWAGSSSAFAVAVAIIVVWAVTGRVFAFSDTWQLVINTGTTIVTFLMVFLIQRSQNKDALAVHLKLNELVAALQGASNRLIDIEAFTERDLRVLQKHYATLADLASKESNISQSHSVEEARARHTSKIKKRTKAASG
jgi:low affinity Fe/Cu permease